MKENRESSDKIIGANMRSSIEIEESEVFAIWEVNILPLIFVNLFFFHNTGNESNFKRDSPFVSQIFPI